ASIVDIRAIPQTQLPNYPNSSSSHLLDLLQAFLNLCLLLVGHVRMWRPLIALLTAHQAAQGILHGAKAADACLTQQLLRIPEFSQGSIDVFDGALGGKYVGDVP